MKRISTAETRKHMSELLNRAMYGSERFVVTRHGKELAAIVPLEDVALLERLRSLLSEREFERAVSEIRSADTRSWDEARRSLDLEP